MKIFLVGFMGAGKSTAGRQLAERLMIPFFDLDEEIEKAEGRSIPQIFEADGEDYFRNVEREELEKLLDFENAVISTGGGTPCFGDNMELMKANGKVIYLKQSPPLLVDRLKGEMGERPLLKHLQPEELEPYVRQKLEEREPFYAAAHQAVEDTQSLIELSL